MRLKLGSQVKTSDGHDIGKLSRIIVEPATKEVRAFVVRAGILIGRSCVVSRSLIDYVGDDQAVHLRLTAGEAGELPAFNNGKRAPIFSGRMHQIDDPLTVAMNGGAPRDAVILGQRSDIRDRSGTRVGRLDEIIYGPDGVASALIVAEGFIAIDIIVVPVSVLGTLRHDRIDLSIDLAQNVASFGRI